MNKRPIGIFDSGVGGLSILKELHSALPHENYIYLADQLNIPYGEKSPERLIAIAIKIADFMIARDIKLLVVACNTATCNAIDTLRKKYSLPIVGTVPAIKTAAQNTGTGMVAVISTPATAESEALKKLIDDNCENISALNIGCKGLMEIVEDGKIGTPEAQKLLKKYLEPVRRSNTDHIVLGCTHYPFLKDDIQTIIGPTVKLLNSGTAIARRVQSLLAVHRMQNTQEAKGGTMYCTTGDARKFSGAVYILLGHSIKADKITI